MPYITTSDHTKLYAKDWGTGRPVVLMHGWPLTADTFDDLAMRLPMPACVPLPTTGAASVDPISHGRATTTIDAADDSVRRRRRLHGADRRSSMGGGEVARYMSRHRGKGVTQADP